MRPFSIINRKDREREGMDEKGRKEDPPFSIGLGSMHISHPPKKKLL